jgi:hypothetical protein
MRFASPAVALATLLLSLTSAFAQTDVTCHIRAFNTVPGPTLHREGTATSINHFGNIVGTDAHKVASGHDFDFVGGRPYIHFIDGRIKVIELPVPLGDFVSDAIFVGKRNQNGITVGYVQFVDPTTNTGAAKGWVNQNGVTTLINRPVLGINKFGTMVAAFPERNSNNQVSIVVLHPNGAQFIPVPDAFKTTNVLIAPQAISDTGVVIGTYAPANHPLGTLHTFVEANGQFQDLAFPGAQATMTMGNDINAAGMIVGRVLNSPLTSSFIYKDGKMFRPIFEFPTGFKTTKNVVINGVNGSGTIVGTLANRTGSIQKPFVGSCDF